MRINSSPPSFNKSSRITPKGPSIGDNKEVSFSKTPKNASIKDQTDPRTSLISRADLLSLAQDLKDGHIDRHEASNRFVSTVVNNSLDRKLSERDLKKLTDDIAEFFSQDQDFLRNLEKNLSTLS